MHWVWRTVWIVSFVAINWWAMMIVHEWGHMLAAWLTGGRVVGWELRPWAFSRTDVAPNPRPLVVAWSGALFGTLAPMVLATGARFARLRLAPLVWLFAGFCLIANGAYLALSSVRRVGDAGTLLGHGAQAWQLWAFGIVAMAGGLWIWHRLSERFEWRTALDNVSRKAAIIACVFAVILFAAMSYVG